VIDVGLSGPDGGNGGEGSLSLLYGVSRGCVRRPSSVIERIPKILSEFYQEVRTCAKLPDNGRRRGEVQQSSQIPKQVSRHVHAPAGTAAAELRNFCMPRELSPHGAAPSGTRSCFGSLYVRSG